MSTQSLTQTRTFTVADIKRVLDNFAADFGMIAQATGLRTRENVNDTVTDLKEFATAGYLQEIHISLSDTTGREIRAVRYIVSSATESWQPQLPGNNLWPRMPGGNLNVSVRWSQKYINLDDAARQSFRQRLRTQWGPASIDFNHTGLTRTLDRRYVSNGWGLEKQNYQ